MEQKEKKERQAEKKGRRERKKEGRIPTAHEIRVNCVYSFGDHLLFLDDVVGEHLGRVEELDGRLVFEDVAFRRRQRVENLVFDLLQLLLVVGAGHDQFLSLHLQLRSNNNDIVHSLHSQWRH